MLVKISAVSKNMVSVAVANVGDTIPPDVVDCNFDRFFRASASRAHCQKSRGLGLAIARMHGGRTTVHSKDGITEVGLELLHMRV